LLKVRSTGRMRHACHDFIRSRVGADFVASAIVQQDAMFRAAIAAWRLQQPDVVRAWLSQLLRLNPQHVEGTALLHLYETQVWRGKPCVRFPGPLALSTDVSLCRWYEGLRYRSCCASCGEHWPVLLFQGGQEAAAGGALHQVAVRWWGLLLCTQALKRCGAANERRRGDL